MAIYYNKLVSDPSPSSCSFVTKVTMETTGATLQHVNEHPKFDSVSVLKSWHDLGGMSPFSLYCRPGCICSQTDLNEVELFLPSLYRCNIALGLSFNMRS